jgi:glycosyltransferase involved in cell wall biosynthesis
VLPDGSERPSGGNLYNQALLDALGGLVSLRRLGPAEWRAAIASGAPGLYFFDSLDFAEGAVVTRAPGQYLGLVVHHLPSLEPGLHDRDRERELASEAAALAAYDVLLCTSHFTSELLHGRGFEPERLITVPPAPPAVRASARRYEPPLRALVVANLIPRKGVLPLLEALARRAERADYRLVIVGRDDIDPGYAEACRSRVARSPYLREHVRIDPAAPHERMLEYYETADLLLSAAEMETFGMAIQEARAHGLPILVRDGGFAREHVQAGANGAVLRDVEAIADLLLALAADEVRMSTLVAGAERTRPAPGYGWRQAAETLLAALGRAPP